jgi:DNA-directed RNA polymerase specialized sigma24 family protein
MATKPPRRVPVEAAATLEAITAAIEALTPGEWAKLRRYADYRIRLLGPKKEGRESDDLLQTALTDLLADTRRWNKPKVGFAGFLIGAIKSISSNWARSFKREEAPAPEADLLRTNEKGETFSPLDNVQARHPDPEQARHQKQTLEQIETLFKEDERAQMVLMAWQEGCDPAGVRELWGLSQNEYNTIVRRIRRRLDDAGMTAHLGRGGN